MVSSDLVSMATQVIRCVIKVRMTSNCDLNSKRVDGCEKRQAETERETERGQGDRWTDRWTIVDWLTRPTQTATATTTISKHESSLAPGQTDYHGEYHRYRIIIIILTIIIISIYCRHIVLFKHSRTGLTPCSSSWHLMCLVVVVDSLFSVLHSRFSILLLTSC